MATTSDSYPIANAAAEPAVKAEVARQILISLIFPTMLMPLASATTRVALPIIRNDFQIPADLTAWVAAAFTVPFMILMAVFGRLSDGLGKRRLLLAGVAIFSVGTLMTILAPNLYWLMAGRAIQGVGGAGLTPLAMALITVVYPAGDRGKALGAWTTVGPTVGFTTPLVAGFLIDHWGWRYSYLPLVLFAVVALIAILLKVPPGLSTIVPGFARRFDWLGVIYLSTGLTALLFYLSSRPITGVAPLQDWRLFLVALAAMLAFVRREWTHANPFIDLRLFTNPLYSRSSACASLRMFTQAGLSILLPLYLVDLHALNAATVGSILMISSGAMALVVRFVGRMTDRWGSRIPALIGLTAQASAFLIYAYLPATAPLWVLGLVLMYYGVGAGAVLVSLHRAAMAGVDAEEMGTAAGVYGTVRFAGAAIGTALAGVMLQYYLDLGLPILAAYQNVFFWFTGFPLLGILIGWGLREPTIEI